MASTVFGSALPLATLQPDHQDWQDETAVNMEIFGGAILFIILVCFGRNLLCQQRKVDDPTAQVALDGWNWFVTQLVALDTFLVTCMSARGNQLVSRPVDIFNWSAGNRIQNSHLVLTLILLMDAVARNYGWMRGRGEYFFCGGDWPLNASEEEQSGTEEAEETQRLLVPEGSVDIFSCIPSRSQDDDAEEEAKTQREEVLLTNLADQSQRAGELVLSISELLIATVAYSDAAHITPGFLPSSAVRLTRSIMEVLPRAFPRLQETIERLYLQRRAMLFLEDEEAGKDDKAGDSRDSAVADCGCLNCMAGVWQAFIFVAIIADVLVQELMACNMDAETFQDGSDSGFSSALGKGDLCVSISRAVSLVLVLESCIVASQAACCGEVHQLLAQSREQWPQSVTTRQLLFMAWIGDFLFAADGGYNLYITDALTATVSMCESVGLEVPADAIRLARSIVKNTQTSIPWAAHKVIPDAMEALLTVLGTSPDDELRARAFCIAQCLQEARATTDVPPEL